MVERTFSWLRSFRRVATRFVVKCHLYDAFVAMACAFVALSNLWNSLYELAEAQAGCSPKHSTTSRRCPP